MTALRHALLAPLAIIALAAGGNMTVAQQSAADVTSLPNAKTCSAHINKFGYYNDRTPGQGTIQMTNDGGWCWIEMAFTSRNTYYVPAMTISQPPRNGTALTGGVDTSGGKRVRLAYRPAPGFTGSDSFTVHMQHAAGDIDANVAVTVAK
jgi:hypothetical protein